ncbi:MAG: FimV/HubP family polar landmark protein [Gammaproteobacteria bacterium]
MISKQIWRNSAALVLGLALLAAHQPSWGFGLGDITVLSGPGEPLNAQIKLTAARKGDLDDTIVALADARIYQRAGIEFMPSLQKLRFEPRETLDGPVIVVTTLDPLQARDPTLTFLVEVQWAKGKLVREYTVDAQPAAVVGLAPQPAVTATPTQPAPAFFPQETAPTIDVPNVSVGEVIEIDAPLPAATAPLADDEISFEEPAPGGEIVFESDAQQPQAVAAAPAEGDILFDSDASQPQGVAAAPESGGIVFDTGASQPVLAAAPEDAGLLFAPEGVSTAPAPVSAVVDAPSDFAYGSNIGPPLYASESEATLFADSGSNIGPPLYANEGLAAGATLLPEPGSGLLFGAENAVAAAGSGYEVRSGDTLGAIAAVNKNDAVSLEQMMLAMQRINPDAFFDDNINNLNAGAILRMPSPDEIRALSYAQALAEVRQQGRQWRRTRESLIAQAGEVPESPLVAPESEPTVAASEAPAPGSRLEIVTGTGADADSASASGGAAGDAVRTELKLAQELAESRSKEREELQSRISDLEQILSKKERLIELQNSQLAALQQKLTERQGLDQIASVEPQPSSDSSVAVAAVTEPAEVSVIAQQITRAQLADSWIFKHWQNMLIGVIVLAGAGFVWRRKARKQEDSMQDIGAFIELN